MGTIYSAGRLESVECCSKYVAITPPVREHTAKCELAHSCAM